MSRCLVLAGSMHFRAWSGGFVINPVEYLPLWGLQPCLHGLWLLVLKWVCVISLIQFRKDMFHEFSWCFRCCKTIFQWTVGCWCLRGWPSGFFYPLHESWNLWVFIIGIIYFSWTNSFSENPQGPCTLTHQIFIMMCNEKHLLGVCRTFWKTGWCFQSGLVYSSLVRGMTEKPAMWNKVHFVNSANMVASALLELVMGTMILVISTGQEGNWIVLGCSSKVTLTLWWTVKLPRNPFY